MKERKEAPIPLVINGACGRMGQTVAKLASQSSGLTVVSLVERRGHPLVGSKVQLGSGAEPEKSIEVTDRLPADLSRGDVVVDFSQRDSVSSLVKDLEKSGARLVCGTTGLGAGEIEALKRYAGMSAVFYDTNMSYGISVLKRLLRAARPFLAGSFDAEIVEMHHRKKKDSPSGTALSLARELSGGGGPAPGRESREETCGVNIHSVRAGGITGEHRVVFASTEEVIELVHTALSREVFARGALRAARFILDKERGLYSMEDLLGRIDA